MSEYSEWIVAYNEYLTHMYRFIFLPYLTLKEKREITFDSFCKFVYSLSSGEISNYL